MNHNPAMRGEQIYECDLAMTGITDYGLSVDDVLTGKKTIPAQGARLDLHVDGSCKGRLSGRQHGVDYLRMRADGRIDLDLHVIVETEDGHRIALSGDGQAAPRNGDPTWDILANIRLTTAAEEYAWVNERQIWAVGTADMTLGKIHVVAYRQ